MNSRFIPAVVVLACLAGAMATPAAAQDADPASVLRETISSDRDLWVAMVALRATEEEELVPFFIAATQAKDKKHRFQAIGALRDIGTAEAGKALVTVVRTDDDPTLRAEALVHAIAMEAISDAQLTEAMQQKDERVQSLAARELVARGKGKTAEATLRELVKSEDSRTAAMARLSLLKMGHKEQRDELKKLFEDAETPDSVIALMLEQIREEKIAAAAQLAAYGATKGRPEPVRLLAYKALDAVAGNASQLIATAIAGSDMVVYRVHLLEELADRKDAAGYLRALAKRKSDISEVIEFELARVTGAEDVEQATLAAVKLGHPIVIRHVADRAAADVEELGAQADFYSPALLHFIQNVNASTRKMTREHVLAAKAATVLIDLATPRATKGLKTILEGRYDAVKRAVAAGLLRSRSDLSTELAMSLLDSPYEEIHTDAVLTLARGGNAAADKPLRQILNHHKRNRPELNVLAAWFLARNTGRTSQAVRALTEKVK
ncbi:MAG: HEAT repeat domain-containing protein [Phycisphaerae bacterium]